MTRLILASRDDLRDLHRTLHWRRRPRRVHIPPAFCARIGSGRAVLLSVAIPVCGCISSVLAAFGFLSWVLWRHGLDGAATSWGPVTTILTATALGVGVKLAVLTGSYALVWGLTFAYRGPRPGTAPAVRRMRGGGKVPPKHGARQVG